MDIICTEPKCQTTAGCQCFRPTSHLELAHREITRLRAEVEKANNEFGCQTADWPGLWQRIAELKEYQGKAEVRAADLRAEVEAKDKRIAELEARLAEAARVIEPFALEANIWEEFGDTETITEDFPDLLSEPTIKVRHLRAARTFKEQTDAD
jgi:chromosome segregation ATPase